MIEEFRPGGSADERPELALVPAMPLAVIDIAMSAPGVPTSGAFWKAELGYLVPEADAAAGSARDGLPKLLERWGASRIGLAACGPATAGTAEPIAGIEQERFCATWLGGGAASDALVALRWVLEGFAGARFERAFLGAITPTDSKGTAETWLVLAPLAAARAAALRVLASWSERPVADAVALVTGVQASEAVTSAAIAAAIPMERSQLPFRTLWMLSGADGADAHAVFTACAVAALAVAHRTLPPSRGLGDWHGPGERGFGRFPRPRPWLLEPDRTPRTALALVPTGRNALAAAFSDADPEGLDPLEFPWPANLFVLSAPSEVALLVEIEALERRLDELPTDAAAAIAIELWAKPRHPHRCAIVASGAADLARHLAAAAARLRAAAAATASTRERVMIGTSRYAGAPIAFVIPGQGSQYAGMLRELAVVSPAARRSLERLTAVFAASGISLTPLLHPAQDLVGTERGRELESFWREVAGGGMAGCMASQALQEFLSMFNVQPSVLLGHSIGETTALTLAEALGPKPPTHMAMLARSFLRLTTDLLRRGGILGGAGIAVSCADRAPVDRALEAYSGRAFLALDNCPHQVVLLGETQAIEAVSADLRAEGASCLDVSLGAPFHTPLFEGAIESLSTFYDGLGIRAPRVPVWSGANNAPFPADPSQMKALLLRQWTETVRFTMAVRSLYDRGVRIFVEVGPGDTLTGFIDDILSGRDHLAVACDSQWFGGLEHLLAALGRLFVAGVEVGPAVRAEPPSPDRVPALAPVGGARPAAARGADAAQIRERHGALLREFEASRARVLRAAPAQLMAGPSRPRARASAFPALGPRRDNSDGTIAFERRMSVESDPYLRDHVFGSIKPPRARELMALPVVPMVITLETLAEAGLAAMGQVSGAVVMAVEHLRLHRWLTLDRGYLDLRVVARPQADSGHALRRVHVELFELNDAAPAGRWSAADATVVLAAGFAALPPGRRLGGQPIEPRLSPEQFRKHFIFQGPSLQCFQRLLHMTDQGIEAEVVVPSRDRLFRDDSDPMLATVANVIDGAGQVIARWPAERWSGWWGFYPFRVDRYEQFGPPPQPGERLRCVVLVQDDGTSADVEFQRPDGAVLFRCRGFKHQRFDFTAELTACVRAYDAEYWFTRPFAAGPGLSGRILDGGYHDIVRPERAIFLQTIAHSVLTARERETWRAIPQGSLRRARWLMGRVAAKEAIRSWAGEHHGVSSSLLDIEIGSDELGKPVARLLGNAPLIAPPEVSISHSDTMAVAVVAEDFSIGVDIEEERDGKPRTVPELAFADGELAEAAQAGVPPLALWCAKEAAAKALGVGLLGEPRRWRVHELASEGRDAIVSIEALRVPVSLHSQDRAIVAVAHASRQVAAEARKALRVAAGSPAEPDA